MSKQQRTKILMKFKQGSIMKKISLMLIVMLLVSMSINAQMRRTPKERAENLKQRLELTDEQTKKVESIYTESEKKAMKLFEQSSGDREESMKSMREIMNESDAKIEKILNKKQKEAFKKIKEERMQRMGG